MSAIQTATKRMPGRRKASVIAHSAHGLPTIRYLWKHDAVDLGGLIVGDEVTRRKYAALFNALVRDPLGTITGVFGAIAEPILADWQAGRYGEAKRPPFRTLPIISSHILTSVHDRHRSIWLGLASMPMMRLMASFSGQVREVKASIIASFTQTNIIMK